MFTFVFYGYGYHRELHVLTQSFPTRRSSELGIRPHAFGRFGDMLLAATRHPAMLLYLDNAASIGPNSRAGQRRHVGLNENHGRELLELHTVSPAAGYTQAEIGRAHV